MKVEIIEKQKVKPKLEYPVLMKNICGGTVDYEKIVLFRSERVGMRIDNGYISNNWIPATDEERWEKFEGTINLSNE